MRTVPLSLSFGATSLADCLDLALISIGGRARLERVSYFDVYGERSGEIESSHVSEELFVPELGTTLCLRSVAAQEFANVSPPSPVLKAWCGLSDHRSDIADRIPRMLDSVGTLYLAIGIEESPDVDDELLAAGAIVERSCDFALAACWRSTLNLPFERAVNEELLRRHPELNWIAAAFGRAGPS
ncbi:MAG: hypothetical protein R2748_34905 [Bryobacterales bacterium]